MLTHDRSRNQENILGNGENEGLGFAELFAEEEGNESEGFGFAELFEEEEVGESSSLGLAELFTENVPLDIMDVRGHPENVVAGEEEEAEKPENYLRQALHNQGLNAIPAGLRESWIDGDYEYMVRIHPGNPEYTTAESIYRVARRTAVEDEHGQRAGWEYLGTDGHWYRERILRETYRNGNQNPDFNEDAARMTHIPLDRNAVLDEDRTGEYEEEEERNE